jgi:HK97 gp10 family phage protein
MYESNRQNVERRIQEQIERALTAIGLYVEGEAKLRCPVDTGNLRGSIDHKAKTDHVVIGTNVEYALFLEKGTQRQKAQPYLTPAVEENTNNIRAITEEYMRGVDDD